MSLRDLNIIPIRPIKIEEKCNVCDLLKSILLKLKEINEKIDGLVSVQRL